jgi:hypothetical protein
MTSCAQNSCFEEKNKTVMKRIIIVNGLIAGFIVSAGMLIYIPFMHTGTVDFDNGMYIGYTSMVISLSMVFFGIKTYRDQHLGGSITFWKGVQIGILITVIASLMYAITWEVYFDIAAPDFMVKYTEHYLKGLKEEGASAAELEAATNEMAESAEMYKNPFVRFGFTLMEIVPVGVLITLTSAGLLRKREVLPA